MADTLRIGNASGYWGDDLSALRRQLEGGELDVITQDFLAEITMSILQKQLARDPSRGYAHDFVDQMRECLGIAMKKGVRIISNAGGVKPFACAEAIRAIAREQGLDPRIGVVDGDDLMDQLDGWHADSIAMDNMDDGRGFGEIAGKLSSANAYFGAAPVVDALRAGAQIVVTGRVTDTGITLAPMIEHFGWAANDYDRLASGIIAGHILECGAQGSGGNFTDWRNVPSFHEIGYPIAEMSADGSFIVTKHPGTGGLINVASVKEQLVYEMGDPLQYISPDVVVDFSSIRLEDAGENRVAVSGVRGMAPTPTLKVSMSYQDGWKASGGVIVSGPDAREKCEAFTKILWERLPEFDATLVEYVGADSTWGPRSPSREANEIFLRFGVRDQDRIKVRAFSKMLPALILSGPPGVAVTGGRPPVQEVVAYWPCLISRELCRGGVRVEGGGESVHEAEVQFEGETAGGRFDALAPTKILAAPRPTGKTKKVALSRVAHGRSGDKGNTCNIGIIARHPALYTWLRDTLSAKRVEELFEGIAFGGVDRFEVPNLWALNFLLHGSLGGGGTLSLHIDAQGKTFSHALLACEFEIDESLLALVEGASV